MFPPYSVVQIPRITRMHSQTTIDPYIVIHKYMHTYVQIDINYKPVHIHFCQQMTYNSFFAKIDHEDEETW